MPRKKGKLQFRYYEVPHGEPLLALYGEAWVRPYGYDKNDIPITDLHFHNLLEIGICYDGKGEMVLEEESFPYQEGTLTVIPKNYPHTTNGADRKANKWEYLFIDVEKTLQDLYPDNRRMAERLAFRINRSAFCTSLSESPGLWQLSVGILEEMKYHSELYQESVEGLLRALFVEIARRNQGLLEGEEAPEGRKKSELTQINRALEYVGDYYDRPLKISDLAGACHMSETHFRRLFVKCMGMHPVDYINLIRIQAACEMLKKTNRSVTEVALKCGFVSSATFNRNFRKFVGYAPNEWKKLPENFERRLAGNRISVHDGW